MSGGWGKKKNLIGTTYFQQSSPFIYFQHFCQLAIYAESFKMNWVHFRECLSATLYVLNKYAVTLTMTPPDGATVGNSLLFHSNSKECFLSKYYREKSLGVAY